MVFTERALMKAFEELLETTPFDRIRVKNVADRCGVSVHTFYYHFQDINDLLRHWIADRKRQIEKETGENADWNTRLLAVLRRMKEHQQVVTNIMQPLPREQIEHFLFDSAEAYFIPEVKKRAGGASEENVHWIADFCSSFAVGYLLRYIWSGFSLDIERDVKRITTLLDGILADGMKKINAK